MIINYKEIGRLLLSHRLKVGLSQKELARRSGYTYVYIYMIEKGRVRLREECLEAICKVLEIDPVEILLLSIDHPLLEFMKHDENLYRMSN